MYGCTVRYVERVFHTGSFIYVGTRTGVPAGCRDPGAGGTRAVAGSLRTIRIRDHVQLTIQLNLVFN